MGKILEENKGQKTDVANGQTEERREDKGYFIIRSHKGASDGNREMEGKTIMKYRWSHGI